MKKILLVVTVGMLAFVAGLAGAYVAMPTVAPDLVETVRQRRDSLALLSDSLLRSDSLRAHADSVLLQAMDYEALAAALRDSLAIERQRLGTAEAREVRQAEQVDQLQRRLRAQAQRQDEAKGLGSTLAKLEDEERRALVGRLDTSVLQAIYAEASRSDRVLLLRAMSPERAARFVGRLMQPAAPSVSRALTSGDEADVPLSQNR